MFVWLDKIANAPPGLLAVFGVLAGAGLVIAGTALRRARLIEDAATARVRSAHQGYIELQGHAVAMDGEPIIAPLSQTQCCWYSYRVERHADKGWRNVQAAVSDGIFVLRDATGDCVVDPHGAEVSSRHSEVWYADSASGVRPGVHARLPSLGRGLDLGVRVGGRMLQSLSVGGEYRFTEAVILDGDPLYAIGSFRSQNAHDHNVGIDEVTAAILRDWKQHPDTLRERFDHNRDGRIDQDEWEDARRVARTQAAREYAEMVMARPIHILAKPGDGRQFLLANYPQHDLLRRYRWRIFWGGLLFLAATVPALLMLQRLMG